MSQAATSWGLARPLLRTPLIIASPMTPPPMNATFMAGSFRRRWGGRGGRGGAGQRRDSLCRGGQPLRGEAVLGRVAGDAGLKKDGHPNRRGHPPADGFREAERIHG